MIYNVIDLFAGAGGLSLGFKQTGQVNIIAAAENSGRLITKELQGVYNFICSGFSKPYKLIVLAFFGLFLHRKSSFLFDYMVALECRIVNNI